MTIAVDFGRKATKQRSRQKDENDHVKSKNVTGESRKIIKITVLNIIQHNNPVI